MIEALRLASFALLVAGALSVVVLAVRRLALGRATAHRVAAEERLRDVALALVGGDPVDVPELSRRDQRLLATLLARYGSKLAGSARDHVAAYFRSSGLQARELDALRSRRAWRRAAAAFTLGDIGADDDATIYWLRRALADSRRDVRAAAARSLGRLGAAAAVADLVDGLVRATIPRSVAGKALLAIGDAALPDLHRLAEHEESVVRAAAIELIGLIGAAADARALAARLRDPAAEVRAKAARALGRLGADEAVDGLRVALGDRIGFVRVNAAHALGDLGDTAAAPLLLDVAREDDYDVAQAASRALAALAPAALEEAATAGPHLAEAADRAAFGVAR